MARFMNNNDFDLDYDASIEWRELYDYGCDRNEDLWCTINNLRFKIDELKKSAYNEKTLIMAFFLIHWKLKLKIGMSVFWLVLMTWHLLNQILKLKENPWIIKWLI